MRKNYLFIGILTISLMIPYWILYKDLTLMGSLLGAGGSLIIREIKNKSSDSEKYLKESYIIAKGPDSEN